MVTQMCVDPQAIVNWLIGTRQAGVTLPVWIGLPGVADLTKLIPLSFRIGVGQSLKMLKKQGHLNQVLLSHDGSCYPQKGKSKRTFEVLFTTFIPMMKGAGFSDEEINQLIKVNPGKAFAIQKRSTWP